MNRYVVIFERTRTGFGAYSTDLPGCIASGDDLDETRRLMREAIALHIDLLRSEAQPVPEGHATAEAVELLEA